MHGCEAMIRSRHDLQKGPRRTTLPSLVRPFILAAVLAVVGACSAAPPSTTADAQDPCANAEQMQAFVVAFLADYNVGRAGLADRFFAPDPAFQ